MKHTGITTLVRVLLALVEAVGVVLLALWGVALVTSLVHACGTDIGSHCECVCCICAERRVSNGCFW